MKKERGDTYKTITKVSSGYFRDRGSKFHAFAYPVETEEEIKECLNAVKKEYYNARHHCYAWQLGGEKTTYRANDDGEPSGSAGRPILGRIQSHELTNILIVVVRYFGGVKLGVPGLINAYKTSAEEAITTNKIITKTVNEIFEIKFEYPLMNDVMRILKEEDITIISQEFEMTCRIRISIRKSESERIKQKILKIRKIDLTYLYTE
ncbi:MAG: YigZ family protein [Bacteroidetes bacterium]|nr:MAG: YigZ family protein [Bacteroidota bacterium]PIE88131.1 MAG: YigZ family protein [Bacteroidota bacterium]